MKKLLITLALLFGVALGSSPANASSHKGYYYNAPNLEVIASAVEASVAKDPTGNTLIAPAKCRRDGSCATPAAYLASFQAHDPEAGLTSVDQVANFMRTRLVKDCTITGSFQMDSIILSGGAARAAVDGMSRSLRKGECVYIDKVTGRVVLAEHCANPVGLRVVRKMVRRRRVVNNPCRYVDFQSVNETAMVVQVRDPNDVCLATRVTTDISVADNGQGWKAVQTDCGTGSCIRNPIGPGMHQIRFSPGNEPAICLDYNGSMSFKNQVRSTDLLANHSGEYHARIYRESNEVPIGLTWGTTGLAFWGSTEDATRAMQKKLGMR
jgi:hypothetical protein